MKHMSRGIYSHVWALVLLSSLVGWAGTVTVVPTSTSNGTILYQYRNTEKGAAGTVALTGSAPRSGLGSLQFTTNGSSDQATFALVDPVSGLGTLGALSALQYDWRRASGGTATGNLAPAIKMAVIKPGVTGSFNTFVWEPVNNGFAAGVPVNTWVASEVLSAGRFWSTRAPFNLRTLSDWIGQPLNSGVMIDTSFVVLDVQVGVGSGWTGTFTGFADNITVAFGGTEPTTYNFEIDTDADGIPDTDDQCPGSSSNSTVVIQGCDSGVPNSLFTSGPHTGCRLSDLLAACAAGASKHGQYVSCVAHLTNELQKASVITGKEKGAIQSCAATAKIP